MRIIRFIDGSEQLRYGRPLDGDRAELLENPLSGDPRPTGEVAEVARLLAPVQPSNIICIGKNYAAHAHESGSDTPEHPILFMKPTGALADPGQPIRIPAACDHGPEVDYECELAVVLGPRPVCDVPADRALEFVLGYTVANDVSARRWQQHGGGGQWVRGKSFDTFCPLGPALLTRDEVPDPQSLPLWTDLNGRRMQDGHTADMIFPVADLIAFISRDTTLPPLTVILTGTPSGVGFARKPPVFLHPGDTVTVAVEPIGQLTNPVEAAPGPAP